MTLTLVFGAVFALTIAGLLGYVTTQLKHARQKSAWHQSLTIAEAGLNYYRWHLAHSPNDLQDGESWCCASPPCSQCGPYEHTYEDPQGGEMGKFSLEIDGVQQCGETTAITITSTGWTNAYPNSKRIIKAKFIQPTIADYAYLLNDNVWAGSDREIKGPYHSNGGIRMDGENKAIVSSAKEDWVCTDSFNCSSCPSNCSVDGGGNCVCPGVFTTANGNEELFSYPVTSFDFNGITMDLANIKDLTKNQGKGLYFSNSNEDGYHLILRNDSTVDIYKITDLDTLYAYNREEGWHYEDSVIDDENYMGNYTVPGDCGLIFVEDDIWLEGEIDSKLTIVSADLENPNKETNVWIVDNIEYRNRDSSNGLVVVGQHNTLIGYNAPESMELHGTYIAQTGHFGRNHYPCYYYPTHCLKDYLEIFGSVVSNGRVGTQWTSGGSISSGFEERENIYDPNQSYYPCPFLPTTSDKRKFYSWEEVE